MNKRFGSKFQDFQIQRQLKKDSGQQPEYCEYNKQDKHAGLNHILAYSFFFVYFFLVIIFMK